MSKPCMIGYGVLMLLAAGMCSNRADGADLPGRLRAGADELILNGAGARHKYLLEMYTAGLYLTQKSRDAASIIAADAPMAIRVEITSSFVSKAKLVAALDDGFHNSTNGKSASISQEIGEFRQCFNDSIVKGDAFDIVYSPSRGTVVHKNGQQKGIIQGLAFKQALFGIWLSDKPADEDLKEALLAANVASGSTVRTR